MTGTPAPHRECTIPGCERPAQIRDRCSLHYQRLLRQGHPDMSSAACHVVGCDRPGVAGQGMCDLHWQRNAKHGDPLIVCPTDGRRHWSESELRLLKHILDASPDGLGHASPGECQEICTILGRSDGSVWQKLSRMRKQRWEQMKAEAAT